MALEDFTRLPDDLPAPADDGATAHLTGLAVPDIPLQASRGKAVHLARLSGRTVAYIYPMTGRPDVALPDGWDMIPGARGCTPQACAFRDHHAELATLGARVFGISTQDTDWQREAAMRLDLPFVLLSDADRKFAGGLDLPTFEAAGMTLIKRLTLVIDDGRITHVFYPVFPPDRHADEVVGWLEANQG